MGRSKGRGQKLAKALISDQGKISLTPRRQAYQIITGQLENKINQLAKKAQTRKDFYEPIADQLRALGYTDILKKDPAFQRIIDFEAAQILQESGTDIQKYHFYHLEEILFEDLKNYQTPNLARALIKSETTPKLFKDDLASNYLGNLYNKDDDFLDFALESVLPLTQETTYLKSLIINNLSKEAAVKLIKESVLEDAFPRLEFGDNSNLNSERSRAAHGLYNYIDKEFSESTTKDDLISNLAKAQGEMMTEYIFSELLKEKKPLKDSQVFNHNTNRQDKINYLDKAIKNGGKDFDKEILKKIYLYFGGDKKAWENNYDSFKHIPSLNGEEILDFIERFNQEGAECPIKYPGQRYNFPANWVNQVNSL